MKVPLERVALVVAFWMFGWATADAGEEGRVRVESVAVTEAPEIDGRDSDVAWSLARGSRVTVREVAGDQKGRSSQVILKSVRTTSHIYFLVSWADATHDATHKTWVWNAEKKGYEQGSDREDVLALAFEHTGTFNADMLSGVEAVWDVWQWKAARTDPAGYAMDKTHHFSKAKPTGKAKSFPAREGSTIWIARPEDDGGSPQKSQPAPGERKGDRVPKYVAGTPSGSAADVRAKGVWQDGRWTVELARKLSTGHADDVALDVRKTYRMGLAVFDHEEHVHHSTSELIELAFVRARVTAGQLPAGWKVDATNPRGRLADWAVVTDAKAADGRKVFTLTKVHDTFGGVFNLCWNPSIRFRNGVIEVKVRANTGRVDQGGGVIWRAKDSNNYYIARCNPLEGNFRLYDVKDGARKILAGAGDLKIAAGEWFTIRIVHQGDAIEGWLNGKKLLAVTDRTFREAGGAGLWTKADAATSFDGFTVKPTG